MVINSCRYTYNPLTVPPEIRESIGVYIKKASEWSKVYFAKGETTIDERIDADGIRSAAHNALGAILEQNGMVRTMLQGKFIGHVILSSLGIEKPPESPQRTGFAKAEIEVRNNTINSD